ncbi:gene D protein [Yersinia pekkanenii]|uniref:Gene D protein n=1 Tax=Yersinia pekkanenii TaxID=1288385 RepID=A0A0T9QK32_9GAMM|nr:gene D protein [Yersinia pekkanenii]CRY68443.1 gene D protein [Yersinia pekkanenii]
MDSATTLTIRARSADFRGSLNSRREASYHDTTLGAVVTQIAQRNKRVASLALTTVYATKAQAMRAAQAKWDKLQRSVAEFSINLAMGRADLYPETPVRLKGFKSVIDQQTWIITKVTHNLGDNGYPTRSEAANKTFGCSCNEKAPKCGAFFRCGQCMDIE